MSVPRARLWLLSLASPLLLLCACPRDTGSCRSVGDCRTNEICIEQRCRRTCNADGDCALDEWCNNGACVPGTPATDRDASAGGDSLRSDAALADSAQPDSAQPDTSLPDAARPDAAQPDTSLPDGAGADSYVPSCDSQYREASGYLLCAELPERCRFGAVTNGSCAELCSDFGGACITAFEDDDMGVSCGFTPEHHCLTPLDHQICECSRGGDTWPDGGVIDVGSYNDFCDSLFGDLPDYQRCHATPDQCEFYVSEGGTSCSELCGVAGRACVESYNDGAGRCERSTTLGCSGGYATFICICSTTPG